MWWVYDTIDHAAAQKHDDANVRQTCVALKQALAILAPVSNRAAPPAILAVARAADPDHREAFEADGETVVGNLVLGFDEAGHIVHAEAAWSPLECRP
jgi:hypothetical protein